MNTIKTSISDSVMLFTFSDFNEDVVASFRMNPADVKLAKRCNEISDYFANIRDGISNISTLQDAINLNDEIEGKVCYLLGYDARSSLFSQISATSIMADGNMFVTTVIKVIADHVGYEIEKRKKSMLAAVEKYTAKYQ